MDPNIEALIGFTEAEAEQVPALVDTLTTKRCGTCNLCCTAMEVFELEKPIGERCQHLDGCGKCAIYPTRPRSCKVFYCTWRLQELIGVKLPWDLKPEQCGFVLHWDRQRSPLCTLFPDPKRPTAWVRYKRKLEQFAEKHDVAIVIGGGAFCTHMVTPMKRWISRVDFPLYFKEGSIGIPSQDFRHKGRWPVHVDPYLEAEHGGNTAG